MHIVTFFWNADIALLDNFIETFYQAFAPRKVAKLYLKKKVIGECRIPVKYCTTLQLLSLNILK